MVSAWSDRLNGHNTRHLSCRLAVSYIDEESIYLAWPATQAADLLPIRVLLGGCCLLEASLCLKD